MYKIFIDGELAWMNSSPEVGLTSAKINLKTNSIDQFTYSMAKTSSMYTTHRMMRSVISVYQDNEQDPIFEGRAKSESVDFYGNKTVTCEGALAYLCDSIQRPADYTGMTISYILGSLLNIHNQQVEDEKKIYLGNVTVIDTTDENAYSGKGHTTTDYSSEKQEEDPYYMYEFEDTSDKTGTDTEATLTTDYESTYDAIQNLLVSHLSGYLHIRYAYGRKYLDYLREYMPSEGQTVLFGSNLLDYSSTLDYTSLCTGVLPLGKSVSDKKSSDQKKAEEDPYYMYETADTTEDTKNNKITIASVNGGSDILWNYNAVQNFGRIVKSVEWSAIDDPSKLLEKARKYLTNTQFDNLSLNAKIVDLHFVDDIVTPLHFLHMIRVKSEPHGLDKMMPISAMDIDLMAPANDSVTLGGTFNSLTGQFADASKDISSATGGISDINKTISNNNKTAWTNITQTDTQISLEAHKRETAVDELGKTIQTEKDAVLKITAEQISSEVSERQKANEQLMADYNSKFTQTAREISAEVNERKYEDGKLTADYTSRISQTARDINASVEDKINGAKTSLQLSINGIDSEVKGANGEINSLKLRSDRTEDTVAGMKATLSDQGLSIQNLNDSINGVSRSYDELKSGLSNGTTTINGNCITTGTIDAARIGAISINKILEDGTYAVLSEKSCYAEGSLLRNTIRDIAHGEVIATESKVKQWVLDQGYKKA